jgi:hypothetical protein
LKRVENETETLFDVEYGEKTEKGGKWETHNVVHRKWWERVKNMKIEKYPLYDLDHGEKTEKHGIWDTQTVGPGLWGENS